jgi:hypothetical protein
MLTGNLPFPKHNLTELHAMMLDGMFVLPGVMSDSLKDLFTKIFEVSVGVGVRVRVGEGEGEGVVGCLCGR